MRLITPVMASTPMAILEGGAAPVPRLYLPLLFQ